MRHAIALLLLAAACDHGERHYTGFVEGEARILRAEVTGRVLEVAFAEGQAVAADAVVARLDDADMQAKLRSKAQELAVVTADIATAEERVALVRSTWERTLAASDADLRQATTTASVAERTPARVRPPSKTAWPIVRALRWFTTASG